MNWSLFKDRFQRLSSQLILGCLLAFSLASAGFAAQSKAVPGADLFADQHIRHFKITISEPELNKLKKDNRKFVRATITEGDKVYTNVGVHLKGNGSFQALEQKPSFSVKFDEYTQGQRYSGMTKFMLNNSSQDGTFLAEYMATSLFRDAGLAAARVTHAYVELNGRDLGLYVLMEAINRDFLNQHFKSGRGVLYEIYLHDIDGTMTVENGRDIGQADIKALVAACQMTNAVARWKKLNELIDVEHFVRFIVLETLTTHTDGYANNVNNFRIYHDPFTDKMFFITHGIDWGFGAPTFPIKPPKRGMVAKAILQTAPGRKMFQETLRQAYTNVFGLEKLTNRVNAVGARLKTNARNANEAQAYENFTTDMRSRLIARYNSVTEQLAAPPPVPLKFDGAGVATIDGWHTKKDLGEPLHDRPMEDGRPTLHIAAGTNICVASWRTSVNLPEGTYRIQGRVRTSGVTRQKNEAAAFGAGVRISGGKRKLGLEGNTGWTMLDFGFEVPDGGDEVELVCELRAQAGEVWFDQNSLRIVRNK